ncbi:hypothetical protein LCGC14_1047400 [marine sediment metagenome]|uniref:Uncharacterized protein n=1 Tax=marine sediment metagenome TaxID=412755 RepID=A0A0F9MPW8_9ZZZZ
MTLNTEVKINGIDVTSKVISWKIDKDISETIRQAKIKLTRSVNTLVTLNNAQTVSIKRGENATEQFVFNGRIDDFIPEMGRVNIVAKDRLADLIDFEVTTTYNKTDAQAGVISNIATNLVTVHGGGFLDMDSTSTVNSGTDLALDQFECNRDDIFERLKKLASHIDYQIFYNPNLSSTLVYFQPEGHLGSKGTFTVGTEIQNVPKWTQSTKELVNDLTIFGAHVEVQTTELKDGDASTTVFTLINTPTTIKVFVGGTLKIGGLENSVPDAEYFVDTDQQNPNITFVTPPGSGSGNIDIRYSYAVPLPVLVTDEASKSTYKVVEKSTTIKHLRSVDDAEIKASAMIGKYANPFLNTKLNIIDVTKVVDLEPGNFISVVDNFNNINKDVLIRKIQMSFPHRFDVLHVGNRDYREPELQSDILKRIKDLEDEGQRGIGILTQVLQASENATFSPRYFVHESTVTSDRNTIGHPTLGYIGDPVNNASNIPTRLIGDNIGAIASDRILQGNNTYIELFVDKDFEDTAITTADWNTSSNGISYTASNTMAQSGAFWRNGDSISEVRMTASFTGSPSFLISADAGNNFQSVSLNSGLSTAVNLNTTGTDLRWQATGIASDSITRMDVEVIS